MAREVRCVLFSAEETRSAVAELVIRRVPSLHPYAVERVEVSERDGTIAAAIQYGRGHTGPSSLDSNELMSAVLMFCQQVRIPLSRRSAKRLELVGSELALIMSLNERRAQPRIEGGTVVHTAETLPGSTLVDMGAR